MTKHTFLKPGTGVSARINRVISDRLPELDLNDLGISELLTSASQLTHLRRLKLSRNRLRGVPEAVKALTGLEQLDLSHNRITVLPDWLGELTNLRMLDLTSNQVVALPKTFCPLRTLILWDNNLTQLAHLDRLTELENLDLAGNRLTTLPSSISNLTKLQHLYLFDNHLKALPASLGDLAQLQTLDLRNNYLISLPEALGDLTNLVDLYLAENRIAELPRSIGQLSSLKALNASHNRLVRLPDSLSQLKSLHVLNLADNKLTSLPDSLARLTQLNVLNLESNQLVALPGSLNNLTSLRMLLLHENDDLPIPAEVLGPTWEVVGRGDQEPADPVAILDYYFRLKEGRRPLNEAKLILVGRGAVGKTSIVNRLVRNAFKYEKKTRGIEITEWNLKIADDEDVRLHVWDFGGQEIMHATHQFFLTQRSLYLLVLNGREGGEDADAEYWLRLIESFGGDSPVIVVLNKINEHPFDVNRRALQQKYSVRSFVRTDCEDGTGIDDLRTAILLETDGLADLRKAFPAGWFGIKDQLTTMQENFLTFERYREICRRHGEDDEKAHQDLAGFLHRLGIILNYRDDPRLRDTHVLSPHWVTNGIYKILNSDKLEKQRGEIRLADLTDILNADDYPLQMQRFILDLMKKFELCFTFPEDDMYFLIPELLDKQQPPEADQFQPRDCLNFQYHYSVIPEGLLPRFTVRTHALSEGLPRWRTGVIVEFEGCRALVKADVQDKRVFISVSGPTANRRRLLAVIRSDFERIHRDIRNLQPEEMVPLPQFPDVVVSYQELLVMERSGMNTLPKVVNGSVTKLSVSELLNGVDLEETRRSTRSQADEPVRLFYSYSHKDETLRNELETHLKLLQRQGVVETWHDRRITPGSEIDSMIDENLERADIILLLVSSDFIASDYCYEQEMKRALERHNHGDAQVVPVIVRDVAWEKAPFSKLSALPRDGRPVELWEHRDSAWRDVASGIEKVIEQIREFRTRWPDTLS